ncbi:MAG TPA: hypothetical protein DIC59_08150 [Candidatus Competibacteraceae bacterium]|nr:hypothetical protein [Candidatus Competibacteraceae bacterium]
MRGWVGAAVDRALALFALEVFTGNLAGDPVPALIAGTAPGVAGVKNSPAVPPPGSEGRPAVGVSTGFGDPVTAVGSGDGFAAASVATAGYAGGSGNAVGIGPATCGSEPWSGSASGGDIAAPLFGTRAGSDTSAGASGGAVGNGAVDSAVKGDGPGIA